MPQPAVSAPVLDARDVCKRYPVGGGGLFARGPVPLLHAVDRISLTVGAGETVGLVGESGCGKTTLTRMLARLIDTTEGSILFGGDDLATVPAARFAGHPARAAIQMVFQDAEGSINPRFTAFDAIAAPLRRLNGLSGAPLRARVERAAEQCGLPLTLLGRYPHQLSGGQKARVGIARAVATEPKLLILDEPTSALDVSVQVVILELLAELKSRLGMSYLFVSHDLNVVRLICDRVLVMYLGRIVEEGPAEAVFRAPAHPYTRALVDSVAVPGQIREGPRLRLSGDPKSPIDPDQNACRFHGRCPRGQDVCGSVAPPEVTPGTGRRAFCHLPLMEHA
ncbi:ABC transporter ATP-binding protein [Elioraea sp.]|uniref:oligopeptide/dipeptide ABC transporter ATP-binding protein n=1 Tax=Elioraea sp. TaxID=2185103 RepID=UPI0025BDA251|nr:ABC transporter ATP-binding protein [Elioraea sp.]